MKVGLVLEGGGMRGLFSAGVLDIMLDNNIEIDGIVGVSAGALFGPNYYSKQKGRSIRYSKRFAKDKRYISKRNLLLTGNAIGKKFAFYTVQKKLDKFDNETFMKTGKPFWAVATNVKTGLPEYFSIEDVDRDMEKLRASSALPLSSKMIKIDGEKYLDGGVSDGIPLDMMLEKDYDKIIVILTQPYKYQKKAVNQKKMRLLKIRYRKYPNLLKTITEWPDKYNDILEKIKSLEEQKKIFVFRPAKKIKVDLIERDAGHLQEIYDLGISEGIKRIKELKRYLKEKK